MAKNAIHSTTWQFTPLVWYVTSCSDCTSFVISFLIFQSLRTMLCKIREWSDEYAQYGFTCITKCDGSHINEWSAMPRDLISSPAKFSLQLDSTDVSYLSQLVVFVRYVKDNMIKDIFYFVSLLQLRQLMWRNLWMTSSETTIFRGIWFLQFVQTELQPCWDKTLVLVYWRKSLHHTSLLHTVLCTSMRWQQKPCLQNYGVLKIVVECVNYVRNSALKHCIFKELCNETGSEFKVLLYHSNIRWLSRGKVLNHVFAMRVELALFLREHQHGHAILSSFSLWRT